MSNEMKISTGAWEVTDGIPNEIDALKGHITIATKTWDIACVFTDIDTKSEAEANAQLIAEAGTVANETGKTPRQLAQENDQLKEKLKEYTLAGFESASGKINQLAQENKMLLEALKEVTDYFILEKQLDDEEYIDMEQKALQAITISNATKNGSK